MTRDDFKNLKLGDMVRLTTHGRNYNKMGIVKEISRIGRHDLINYPIKDVDVSVPIDRYGTWISVDEKLPEKPIYDWVLIQCKMVPENYYGVPHIGELRHGVWYSDCYDTPLEDAAGVKVTHWCPLPNIPNDGGCN